MRLPAFCLFLLGAASINAQTEAVLMAGTAQVDITPANPMPMYGYADRKCGESNGIRDPLHAKALVLDYAGSRMAIVTLDLGTIVSERLKDEVAEKLKIPVLLLAASHTHSAPAFLPFGSAPVSDTAGAAYKAALEKNIFDAVDQASKSMFPAKLAVARGSIQLGYNRLKLQPDGRARVMYRNPERIPYGPVDPEFVLLRVDDVSGRTRALLVHYAAHAVVLGQSNCKFSGDYPGVMQAYVEGEIPETQVMFVQGGAGDINPLFLGRTEQEPADFATVQKMGEILGAEVLRANANVRPVPSGPIQFRSDMLQFPHRWSKEQSISVGITTVMIGKEIAIATVPGEPLLELQKMWKRQAEVRHSLFYGYTYSNGGTWAGYIPDLRSAARGGYGADASTIIAVGAGERILQQHLIQLYDMQGMWRDKPGQP